MASKFTSALAQGGLSGKSKVRTGAPNKGVGVSDILKSKTTAFTKPRGKGSLLAAWWISDALPNLKKMSDPRRHFVETAMGFSAL
jgi:hypothetical protein